MRKGGSRYSWLTTVKYDDCRNNYEFHLFSFLLKEGIFIRRKLLSILVVSLLLFVFVNLVMALDTSPYLIGDWESWGGRGEYVNGIWTDFSIINPTTVNLDVYAAFFRENGEFFKCYKYLLSPNAKWYLPAWFLELENGDWAGTAKFFAFPAGKRKVNEDAVIGGFQFKEGFPWGYPDYRYFQTAAGLRAVTINKFTQGEFNTILNLECPTWIIPE